MNGEGKGKAGRQIRGGETSPLSRLNKLVSVLRAICTLDIGTCSLAV